MTTMIYAKPPKWIEVGRGRTTDIVDFDTHFECAIRTFTLKVDFLLFTTEPESGYYRGPHFPLSDWSEGMRDMREIGYAVAHDRDAGPPWISLHIDAPELPAPLEAVMVPYSDRRRTLPDYLVDEPSRFKFWEEWTILWNRKGGVPPLSGSS